ncbi:unnamed protein product [Lactuca virosa]|uniref:Uncharacterized protein n=1 Tax=Lactuca virosa TaxID=75947 RepID=A0AAU9N206_9ASTR|nr:unnamed protein product [Lactuca virosa]
MRHSQPSGKADGDERPSPSSAALFSVDIAGAARLRPTFLLLRRICSPLSRPLSSVLPQKDLKSRRDRYSCQPTKEDVKRCFMLEFDRSAFIIASTTTEEEMLSWTMVSQLVKQEQIEIIVAKAKEIHPSY